MRRNPGSKVLTRRKGSCTKLEIKETKSVPKAASTAAKIAKMLIVINEAIKMVKLRPTLGLTIGKAHRIFRAVKADAYDQRYLDCQPHDPVFEVEQLCFLADGRLFEYSQTRNRYDRGSQILLDAYN